MMHQDMRTPGTLVLGAGLTHEHQHQILCVFYTLQ